MPYGSFTFSPYPPALALDATPVGVFLYDPTVDPDGGGEDDGENSPWYTLLPNVRCEQIQYKEGVEPPTARFSYYLDDMANAQNGWPNQFDNIWPLTVAPSNYVVGNGTELVVLAFLGDGTTRVLWHGYSRVPQTDLTPSSQHVTFVGVGVAIRGWDIPIGGRLQRQGTDPVGVNDDPEVLTDLPTRFNPAGIATTFVGGYQPNCTASGCDVDEGEESPYPVFFEPTYDSTPAPRLWTLSGAIRYILAVWNTLQSGDSACDLMLDNPDFGVLDSLLQNRRPNPGETFYDPSDSSTYQTDDNLIRDYDATNKPWPVVVAELLGFYGFGMRWVCEDDQYGRPHDYLAVYRKDAAGPTDPLQIYLPETGSYLTEALANVSTFHAAFDYHAVANQVFIESHPERYEMSLILAPGYTRRRPTRRRLWPWRSSHRRISKRRARPRRRGRSIDTTSPTSAARGTGQSPIRPGPPSRAQRSTSARFSPIPTMRTPTPATTKTSTTTPAQPATRRSPMYGATALDAISSSARTRLTSRSRRNSPYPATMTARTLLAFGMAFRDPGRTSRAALC